MKEIDYNLIKSIVYGAVKQMQNNHPDMDYNSEMWQKSFSKRLFGLLKDHIGLSVSGGRNHTSQNKERKKKRRSNRWEHVQSRRELLTEAREILIEFKEHSDLVERIEESLQITDVMKRV